MTNLSRCLALLLVGLAPGLVEGQDYSFVVGFRSMEVGVGQPPNPSLQSYFTVDDQTRAEVGPLTVTEAASRTASCPRRPRSAR